jgi:transcriptional regulator with XRE-family HTH domain
MKFSGKQVAASRELLGLTQDEFAAAAGVSFRTVSRFERGEVEPRRESLRKIELELERRGIEFTNGDGIGVRLNYAKAAEFAKSAMPRSD